LWSPFRGLTRALVSPAKPCLQANTRSLLGSSRRIAGLQLFHFVTHNHHIDGAETMQVWPHGFLPTNKRSRFTARARKEAVLRYLFRIPCSPEAKADFAMHFKALRWRAGLTQTELGHMIGLCRQSVSEIENCRVWPHYTTLECFCKFEAKYLDS